jgi:hypothetical protein
MTEPLSLTDPQQACIAFGIADASVLGSTPRIYWDPKPEHECERDCLVLSWRPEDGESPVFSFALRDAVRKVAPGSYCIPIPTMDRATFDTPALRVVLADEWGHWTPKMDSQKALDKRYRASGHSHYGDTETEAWARALISLWRAGLLPEGQK